MPYRRVARPLAASVLRVLMPLALLVAPALVRGQAHPPAPAIEWQKCFGGTSDDFAYSVIQTRDGGYAFCGYTTSFDGQAKDHHAGSGEDAWVVKTSANGTLEWEKCLGGSANEEANSIVQTPDGGYVVAIRTESGDGDIHGYHGNGDAWIVRLSATGDILWSHCYGGYDADDPSSIVLTPDHQIAFAGFTRSTDMIESAGKHGVGDDMWVVKIDTAVERPTFERFLGGYERDVANAIAVTADGGFIVAGLSNSKTGDLASYTGKDTFYDAWVVKLNAAGEIEWQHRYGGSGSDWANAVTQTSDGGYAVGGVTNSYDRDISHNHGRGDAWLMKLDPAGVIEWERTIGGAEYDAIRSVVETQDGGLAVAGFTNSIDGDAWSNHGGPDILVSKYTMQGGLEWEKCLGGTGIERAYSVAATNDTALVIAGYASSLDGDVKGVHGGYDAWIVKLRQNIAATNAAVGAVASSSMLSLRASARFASHTVALDYDIPTFSSTVSILVTDLTGRTVLSEQHASVLPGSFSRNLELGAVSAGTYFVTLRACGVSQTVRVQIVD